MITKYRNRSLIYLTVAVVLSVVLGLLMHKTIHTRISERSGGVLAFLIIGYIVAWISWVLVGFSLARAKGYSQDFTGTLFMVVYFFGICLPIVVVAFPLYILFGMEDKAKNRSRRR